ncbi:MAG: hypothetical protein U0T82_05680 [Bacteroidales bacterium]
MPYRRLPNTDAARLKALRTAFVKGKELPPFKLAFSQATFQRVSSFLPGFEHVISQHRMAYSNQVKKSKEYQTSFKKAKMYISHFIQVMNMAIARGELPATARSFFKLAEDDSRLPSLNTETEVIQWGENIIQGEAQRIMKGMSPITNPTIAVVKVRYENFVDSYKFQKTLQKSSERALLDLNEQRRIADSIITQIWNEVEAAYNDLPEEIRRDKAADYGVVYVFRKNELPSLSVLQNVQLTLI